MQVGLVLLEHAEGLLSIPFENHDHEGTHKVGRVRDLCEIGALCIVVDSGCALKAVALEKLLELTAEPMCHCEVERAEVLVEGHISKIL